MQKTFKVLIYSLVLLVVLGIGRISSVSAHVVVNPNTANVGARTTFSVSVPVEKDIATTGVRLLIPEGIKSVTPNVKPGWKITTTSSEITWTGGTIPVGQRDDFLFRTQVPASETTLVWKAYQTYADGSVVAWDADPKTINEGDESGDKPGPYSETKIVNDLVKSESKTSSTDSNSAMLISVVALIGAGAALLMQFASKKA